MHTLLLLSQAHRHILMLDAPRTELLRQESLPPAVLHADWVWLSVLSGGYGSTM